MQLPVPFRMVLRDRSAHRAGAAGRRARLRFDALESRALLAVTSVTAINPLLPHPVAGTSFTTTVADFTANDTGPFSAMINWGDGHSTPGTINSLGANSYSVTGTHTYLAATIAGQYENVTVSIVDSQDPATTPPSIANSGAIVDDAAINLTPETINVIRGGAFNGDVATFTSNNPFAPSASFTALVNWGDGSPNSAANVVEDANAVFHVVGSHTYTSASAASFPISITVTSVGGSNAQTTAALADVQNSALVAQPLTIVGQEGVDLSAVPVAVFSDSGGGLPITDYVATINWGDGTTSTATSIIALGNSTFEATGTHTYALGGTYNVSVTIGSLAPNIEDPSTAAASTATIAWLPAVAIPVNPLSFKEETFASGTVAAFSSPAGTTPLPQSNYSAMINWGDETAPSQGFVTAAGAGVYVVNGVHNYSHAPSNATTTYIVTITISDAAGHTTTQATAAITVVPTGVTGALNPATDTGLSHSDAITNDNQPAFYGTAQPYSSVTVLAQPNSGGAAVSLGQAQTNGAGYWSLTSSSALADGSYTVTVRESDSAGFFIASAQLLPNATQGPLVIDTAGPKVTGLQFNPVTGKIAVTFQDGSSGLEQQPLVDGGNYVFNGKLLHGGLKFGRAFLITNISASPQTSPTAPQTVVLTINGGHVIRGGVFTILVRSGGISGIQDVAGNALSGAFYGYFPSGNNRPGGDFSARFLFIHGHGSIPLPIASSASPNAPPGSLGTPFRVYQFKTPRRAVSGLAAKDLGRTHAKPLEITRHRGAAPTLVAEKLSVRADLFARRADLELPGARATHAVITHPQDSSKRTEKKA